jgi:transcriptional regulator with XRE-family HTH domain
MYKTNEKQWINLILLRQKKGISQSGLSKLVGYTQGYISLMESGERVPTYDNLLKISEALECSVEDISNKSAATHLLNILKGHIESLTELEMEKVIDYIEVLKRGRR